MPLSRCCMLSTYPCNIVFYWYLYIWHLNSTYLTFRTVKVIGTETLEYWPRLALSAYVKENGIDLEEEETENGVEISKKVEDSGKNDSQNVSDDHKVDRAIVNGDKCDKTDVKSDLEEMVTSSCDITSPVPETDSKIACDSRTGDVNMDVEDKDGKDFSCSEKNSSSSRGIETKEGSRELLLFNEDIVCQHNLLSPTASSCNIPQDLAVEIMNLCGESIHPAIYQEDFSSCPDCGVSAVLW